MKVLYHHRTLKTDAQGIHVDRLIEALRREGHEVVELSLVTGASDGGAERGGGWGFVRRLARGPLRELMELAYNAVAYPRLRREAKRIAPDLFYERYSLHTHAGGFAARAARAPYVIEVNAPLARERAETEGLFFRGLARRSERSALERADRVIAVTSALKAILVEEGVLASRIVVMPNGVDLAAFDRVTESDVAAFRREHGLVPPVVGFVGFVRPWHGVDMLLTAMDSPELAAEANATVAIVGDGPALPDAKRRAALGALVGRVKFTGAIDAARIPVAIRSFDVAVQPAATSYACPIKLVEYMGAGRAIVAPDQENIVEIVSREAAALFRPMDALDCRRQIRRLLLDPAERERLALASRRRLLERDLTWDGNARRVADLAREIRLEKREKRS
jgi:glycosyltransferase involved in cell wall biosynthesis